MKDTIRLSQRNKDRLSAWDDDGNKAIELALDAHDRLSVKDATREEFKGMFNRATFASVPSTASYTCATGTSGGTISGVGGAPIQGGMVTIDTAYWKKLESTVDSCIEKAKRY